MGERGRHHKPGWPLADKCSCRCLDGIDEKLQEIVVLLRAIKDKPGGSVDLTPVLNRLDQLQRTEANVAVELDALKAEVARNTSVDESAIALLNGLAAKIQELINAGGSPAEFQALADSLKGSSDALAAAVSANTPAAP